MPIPLKRDLIRKFCRFRKSESLPVHNEKQTNKTNSCAIFSLSFTIAIIRVATGRLEVKILVRLGNLQQELRITVNSVITALGMAVIFIYHFLQREKALPYC